MTTTVLFTHKAPSIMARLMRDLTITVWQAAGILGNIGHECNGFTQLHQVGGNAVGWIQWDGIRKRAFLAWCTRKGLAWTSDEANYGYLVEETLTLEKASLVALRATKTVKDATDAFEQQNERAGVPALLSREHWAQIALDAYRAAGQPVPDDPGVLLPTAPVPKPPNVPVIVTGCGAAVVAVHALGVPWLAIAAIAVAAIVAVGAFLVWRGK